MEGQGLGDMASAERELVTQVWSRASSEVKGQSPWSGARGQSFEAFIRLKAGPKLCCQYVKSLGSSLWRLLLSFPASKERQVPLAHAYRRSCYLLTYL